MPKYYLIRGEQIIGAIDSDGGDVIALPLLGGGDAMSLLNEQHASNLMANLGLTAHEALAALGMADLRDTMLKSVFVGANPVSHVSGIAAYHLIDVGEYALWQVEGSRPICWRCTPGCGRWSRLRRSAYSLWCRRSAAHSTPQRCGLLRG